MTTQSTDREAGIRDPITVLAEMNDITLSNKLAALQVHGTHNSEPTTPSSNSPSSSLLDSSLREFLDTQLTLAPGNPKVYVKFLVSNSAAGSVIGKNGANITEIQNKSLARIQLSKSSDYFPGTSERTLVTTGRFKHVIAAISLILQKLLREGVAPLSPRSKTHHQSEAAFENTVVDPSCYNVHLRVLIPQPLCGLLIGKGGTTVRSLAEQTDATIKFLIPEPANAAHMNHKIVSVIGNTERILKAITLMTLKQLADPKYATYGDLPSFNSNVFNGAAVLPIHYGHPMLSYMQPANYSNGAPMFYSSDSYTTQIAMTMTEEQAAIVYGSRQKGIEALQQAASVKIRIETIAQDASRHGKQIRVKLKRFVISGSPECIQYAHYMIFQCLTTGDAIPQFQTRERPPAILSPAGSSGHLQHYDYNGTTYYQ